MLKFSGVCQFAANRFLPGMSCLCSESKRSSSAKEETATRVEICTWCGAGCDASFALLLHNHRMSTCVTKYFTLGCRNMSFPPCHPEDFVLVKELLLFGRCDRPWLQSMMLEKTGLWIDLGPMLDEGHNYAAILPTGEIHFPWIHRH